ncbi:MAG TPA: hypothetical protein VFG45_04200 [Candidatus Nitrosocosmicus sp.]|nr:hypothetical protein [Candidatus Nitrosocosmicus sp.]
MKVTCFSYGVQKLLLSVMLLSIVTTLSFQNSIENVYSQDSHSNNNKDCNKEASGPIGGGNGQSSMNSGNEDEQNDQASGPIGGAGSYNQIPEASIQRVGFEKISGGIDVSDTPSNSETGIDTTDLDTASADCAPSTSMEFIFKLTITSTTEVADFASGYMFNNVLICVVTDPVDSVEQANPDCKAPAALPGTTYTLQSPGKVIIGYSYSSDRGVTVDTGQCEQFINYGEHKSCFVKFVLAPIDETSSSGGPVR